MFSIIMYTRMLNSTFARTPSLGEQKRREKFYLERGEEDPSKCIINDRTLHVYWSAVCGVAPALKATQTTQYCVSTRGVSSVCVYLVRFSASSDQDKHIFDSFVLTDGTFRCLFWVKTIY